MGGDYNPAFLKSDQSASSSIDEPAFEFHVFGVGRNRDPDQILSGAQEGCSAENVQIY